MRGHIPSGLCFLTHLLAQSATAKEDAVLFSLCLSLWLYHQCEPAHKTVGQNRQENAKVDKKHDGILLNYVMNTQ